MHTKNLASIYTFFFGNIKDCNSKGLKNKSTVLPMIVKPGRSSFQLNSFSAPGETSSFVWDWQWKTVSNWLLRDGGGTLRIPVSRHNYFLPPAFNSACLKVIGPTFYNITKKVYIKWCIYSLFPLHLYTHNRAWIDDTVLRIWITFISFASMSHGQLCTVNYFHL